MNILSEYENIDDNSHLITESIYANPVFDYHDKGKDKLFSSANDGLPENVLDQSPYEEVALNVANTDDASMLCLTFRSIFIGILLTCFMSFSVQFFAYRTSPLDVNVGIVILLAYVIGKLMAMFLPYRIFNISTNPGPFTIKELTIITMMATSGSRTYEAMEILTIQRLYYNYHINHFNSIIFVIMMHFLAISIAGILKRYLVWPASMIWPKTLMSCSLIRTLDNEKLLNNEASRWTMSRSKFFGLVIFFQFLWYWLPGYIFPLLSAFSVICMLAPGNLILAQITGADGLAIGAFELDWNAWVAYLDSPILVPFWAHVNIFIGFIFVVWIGTPLIYYLNLWNTQTMPIISNRVFDSDGYLYDTTKILNKDLHLNQTAYLEYGEVCLTAGYAVSYGFLFAGVTAVLVHTILYHGKSIMEQFQSNLSDKTNDIHAKLMSHYPEVAEWWYYILLLTSTFITFILVYLTDLMPAYIVFLSVVISFIFTVPMGIITAITNMTMNTTALSDFLSGVILAGNPVGYLTFRTYTYTCQNQILSYLLNFKFAHYMKIPSHITFPLLIGSAMLTSLTHYLTAIYLLDSVPGICTPTNPLWKCLNAENTYTSSITFGIVGSFNPGSKYSVLLFGFLIGLILPIISWYLWKTFPNIKWLALINFPILLMATNNIPPAPAAEFPSFFCWWRKYAYIFSAGMSCGVAICGFAIFFVFETNRIYFPQWWGLGNITRDGCPLASANFSGDLPVYRDL